MRVLLVGLRPWALIMGVAVGGGGCRGFVVASAAAVLVVHGLQPTSHVLVLCCWSMLVGQLTLLVCACLGFLLCFSLSDCFPTTV